MIKIKVTEEDIKKGKRFNSACCPVGLACQRVLHKNWAEVFEFLTLRQTENGLRIYFEMQGVAGFISKFDSGETVQPFEFELPEEVRGLN